MKNKSMDNTLLLEYKYFVLLDVKGIIVDEYNKNNGVRPHVV